MRKGCLIAVGAIAFIVGSTLWYLNGLAAGAHADLQREVAAARAAGIATKPVDLAVPEPPPGTNAAPLWAELTAVHSRRRVSEEDRIALDSMRRDPQPTPAKFRAAIQRRADIVGLVHGALEKPHCVYHYDWTKGPALLLPDLAYMRFAARFCLSEGRVLCQEGKPIEGVRRIGKAFRIAQQLEEEPAMLIGHLVGSAANAIAFAGMGEVLQRAGTQPGVARAVHAEIEREWRPRTLRRSLECEAVMQMVMMEMLRKKGGMRLPSSAVASRTSLGAEPLVLEGGWRPPYWTAFVDNNAAFVVRNLRMMVRDSDLPCPQASASLQAIGKAMSRTVRTPQLALAWILLPDFTGLPTKAAEDRARAAAMLSAASALDWRVRNGSFPAALSEAMPRVPQDPFDLKPIRYRREGNGFVVWSVGKTGHFGGGRRGVKAPSDEVAFRYPPPPRP